MLIYMRIFRLATLFYLAFCSLPLFANSGQATEQVSLQLKWLHSFQFAGYYAAKEKGFYAEEMLDVTIQERISGTVLLASAVVATLAAVRSRRSTK